MSEKEMAGFQFIMGVRVLALRYNEAWIYKYEGRNSFRATQGMNEYLNEHAADDTIN